MFFITRGALSYLKKAGSMASMTLRKSHWFCEAVLWTTWVTRGPMLARLESELLRIDSQAFRAAVREYPSELMIFKQYGIEFVAELNALGDDICDVGPEVQAMIANHESEKDSTRVLPLLPDTHATL